MPFCNFQKGHHTHHRQKVKKKENKCYEFFFFLFSFFLHFLRSLVPVFCCSVSIDPLTQKKKKRKRKIKTFNFSIGNGHPDNNVVWWLLLCGFFKSLVKYRVVSYKPHPYCPSLSFSLLPHLYLSLPRLCLQFTDQIR